MRDRSTFAYLNDSDRNMLTYLSNAFSNASSAASPASTPDTTQPNQQLSAAEQSEYTYPQKDCTPCRVLGSVTFIGTGLYAFTVKPERSTLENIDAWKASQAARATGRTVSQGTADKALPTFWKYSFARMQTAAPRVFGVAFLGAGLYRWFMP